MFNDFAEQFQRSFQPMSEMAAVNAKAMEILAEQQTSLFTAILNDGVACAKGLNGEYDLTTVMEAQKSYAEGVQQKMADTAKEAYSVLAETQEKLGELMSGAFTTATESATASKAAKTSTKKAVKSEAKAATK